MTIKQALVRMRAAQEIKGIEDAHLTADEILCEYLKSHGASELVEEWHKICKWYC